MRYEFKPSFEDSIKNLNLEDRGEIIKAAFQVIDILGRERMLHKGVGLKRLKGDYWEIRKGLDARILFRFSGDLVEFVLSGNHDQIKRYLRNLKS
jgi:hypothetical protein